MGNWIDKIKRGLALLTAAILLVSAAPVSALAEGDQGSPAVFGIAVMGQNESASYTMPQATVYLTDILDAVGFTAANNAALSVDSGVLTLSHTTVKNKTLSAITLTASGYFDAATLTITKNKNSVQTILLSYPAPEIPAPQPLYLTIAFEEREQEGAEPVYQAIDAQSIPGAEVVEAFRVTENGGYTYVKPTLSALPELAAGQSLALYGVAEDGALFDYPVQENLVLGDSVSLPLSWYAGFALVRVGQALAEQTLVAQLPQELADASLTLSGLLPQGAAAEVTEQPAPAAVNPEAVLLSLDISLGDYAPQEPVTVTVTHPAFAAAPAAVPVPLPAAAPAAVPAPAPDGAARPGMPRLAMSGILTRGELALKNLVRKGVAASTSLLSSTYFSRDFLNFSLACISLVLTVPSGHSIDSAIDDSGISLK